MSLASSLLGAVERAESESAELEFQGVVRPRRSEPVVRGDQRHRCHRELRRRGHCVRRKRRRHAVRRRFERRAGVSIPRPSPTRSRNTRGNTAPDARWRAGPIKRIQWRSFQSPRPRCRWSSQRLEPTTPAQGSRRRRSPSEPSISGTALRAIRARRKTSGSRSNANCRGFEARGSMASPRW